jgi:uncharacterized protein (DUF2384 family)
MRPFSPELDREIDRVAEAWVTGLPIWQLEAAAGGRGVCRLCLRYAAELQLDELPHDLLHLLASALENLVAVHARTDDDAPLGDVAVAEVLRRRAVARMLTRHSAIAWAVQAYIEPQIQRLSNRMMEETCGR